MKLKCITIISIISILFVSSITGCGNSLSSNVTNTEATSDTITFQDDLDQEVTLECSNNYKVAVLSGSLAEAWELAGGTLVAVTDDYTETENQAGSSPISVGSLTAPSLDILADNEINLAILSSNISDQVTLKGNLEDLGIQTIYFNVETFDEYAHMMSILTQITGRSDLYDKNVKSVQDEISVQIERASNSGPTILFLRSYSSGIKAKGSDSMTGKMMNDLGCINIADSDTSFIDNLSLEAILVSDPDYIFVTTMGEAEAALSTLENTFTSNSSWSSLKAVKNNHVYILPKELFQNKPNERWGESYKYLADILYGE